MTQSAAESAITHGRVRGRRGRPDRHGPVQVRGGPLAVAVRGHAGDTGRHGHDHRRLAGLGSGPPSRARTFCCTSVPSTCPFALPITKPMTLPISLTEVAPVAAKASSTSASTAASSSWAGAKGAMTSRSAFSLSASSVRPGALEGLDGLGALLDLFAGDLAASRPRTVRGRARPPCSGSRTGTSAGRQRAPCRPPSSRSVIWSWIWAFVVEPVTRLLPCFAWIVSRWSVSDVLCVLYGALIEHHWYRLRRYRLAILPADGPETLTVLHLSDLHFVRRRCRRRHGSWRRCPRPTSRS